MVTHPPGEVSAPAPLPFTTEVQARFRKLCAEDAIADAQEVLESHAPMDLDQHIDFDMAHGAVQAMLANYTGAIARMVGALRRTSKAPERRVYVRTRLGGLLYRIGGLEAAERQYRRALADIHATGRERVQIPWLLYGIAVLEMNRGRLSNAIRLTVEGEREIAAQAPDPIAVFTLRNLAALSLIEKGDLAAAGAAFDDLAANAPEASAARLVSLHVGQALQAIYARDFAGAEAALARAAESHGALNMRSDVLIRQYVGELRLAEGRAAEVLPELEALLRDVLDHAADGDHVPMSARLLAAALHAVGRHAEGLSHATLAARSAGARDVLEWAAAQRIAGQCLAALDRLDEARAAFAEVHAALELTEFELEKERLASAMRSAGVAAHRAAARPAAPGRPARTPRRLALADGRAFATFDDALCARIARAAATRLPVIIEGETGTGKELVACLLHELGDRAAAPHVVVDCSTLPEAIAEAELFGTARGAYTGAVSERDGLLAAADGGTVLLDELHALSHAVQAKLLRVVQDGTYRRVGEAKTRRTDARVLVATNLDLERLVADRRIKSDLFFRLNGHRLQLPSLRAQPDLVVWLADEVARACGVAGVGPAALAVLRPHPWPGNMRQLEMAVRVAAAGRSPGSLLDADDFTLPSIGERAPAGPGRLREQRLLAERELLERTLEREGHNVAAAARALSMSRQGFYKAMRRAGISPPSSTDG